MLSKNKRITKVTDFERIAKLGNKCTTPNFFAKYIFFDKNNNRLKDLKLAVSVGLKISKKATERNRLRRRVYAVVEQVLKTENQKNENQVGKILIMPKKEAAALETAEFSQEIKLLINKILKNG